MKTRFRVAVIKIGAIGDFCMAIPALTMCAKHNNTLIITGKLCRDLAKEFVPQAMVGVINERCLTWRGLGFLPTTLLSIWLRLLKHRPTRVFVLHRNWRYLVFAFPVVLWGGQIRRFSECNRGIVPGRNHRFEYLRFLGGATDDSIKLESQGRSGYATGSGGGRKEVVICPGGARNVLREDSIRRWPLVQYVELAQRLVERGFNVTIAGGESDRNFMQAFSSLNVRIEIGNRGLVSFIKFLASKDIVVTHDSGPLHLAGLAGCRIIALFGPTNPWEKVPIGVNVTVLWKGQSLSCCPCYDGRTYANCGHRSCLKDLSVELVEKAVVSALR